jgi:hypothetical protein
MKIKKYISHKHLLVFTSKSTIWNISELHTYFVYSTTEVSAFISSTISIIVFWTFWVLKKVERKKELFEAIGSFEGK